MSKRNEVVLATDDKDTEVELNALELLQLSGPGVDQNGVPASASPAAGSKTAKRLSLSLGFLLAVAGGGGIYAHISQKEAEESARPRPTSSLLAIQPETEEPAPEPPPSGESVRFANPFDKSEVFEFPAGTSREEARQAVAQMLLERAAERQIYLNARKKKH